MGRAKTVEINGRKYDAATGKLLNKPANINRGGSIDGFSRAMPANNLHAHSTKSKTLDRKVVSHAKKQPAPKAVSHPKPVQHKTHAKSRAHSVDENRKHRASTVKKSSLISKFGRPSAATSPTVSAKPAIQPQHHTPPMQMEASEYSSNESNKEKEKKVKKKNPRRFMAFKMSAPKARSVFAGAALFVLVAGYVTYLNIPNLSLRIAASRAGTDATMPGYRPSGFAMAGPINYSQGLVTLNFKSNTDDRAYSIAERQSSWDSESLLANYVENETPNYVTFQDKGLTVYIYEGSNATWVDGGIWYTIEGDSQLNSDQLLKIAASM